MVSRAFCCDCDTPSAGFCLSSVFRLENHIGGAEQQQSLRPFLILQRLTPPSSPLIHRLQVNKVRAKSYGENYQWEGDNDMEGTVRLRLTHK